MAQQEASFGNGGKPVKDLKPPPPPGAGGPLASTLAQTARPPQLPPGPPMRQPLPPPPGPMTPPGMTVPPGGRAMGPMAVKPPAPMAGGMRPMPPAAGGQPPIFSPLSVGNVPGAAPPKYSNSDLGEILSKLYRG
jgi:hypothetical protein